MKIHNIIVVICAPIGAFFISGCATITRGTTEQLTIQSEPTGATVRLSNGFTGVTPATFTVPRKGDLFVTASKEGYENAELALKSKLSGGGTAGFLGNALVGGLIGGGIDVATGATLSHVPNPVVLRLTPKIASAPTPSPAAITAAPSVVAAPAAVSASGAKEAAPTNAVTPADATPAKEAIAPAVPQEPQPANATPETVIKAQAPDSPLPTSEPIASGEAASKEAPKP